MLDDLKMIHSRDAQDALGIAGKQYEQLEHVFEITPQVKPGNIENIIYAGMGGSALAALLAGSCFEIPVPFEVVRDYTLPAYVGENTLVITASYSGNTEETLSVFNEAFRKNCRIAVIAGGGKLADMANEHGCPLAILPKAQQPRYAVLYNLVAVATILDEAGITVSAREKLHKPAEFLKDALKAWQADVPTEKNPAKKFAKEMVGSSPVIYASSLFAPVAYKWKIGFNENAKNVAWQGTYPEFNHNEFIGWSSHPIDKPYKVVDLRSNLDYPRTQKRFEVSDRMLSGKRPAAHVVQLQGTDVLEQILWGVAFGDFVTIYTALLNGLNPTPVELVEKFKKELQ
ncbi:MAG TPA: bifunctional phosphoglucose/phosphomannose isomerase [Candidatus Saccharimonadales bacterium]|nr:bifunctional phosphoglucose/phosphomannose isomerase [Candidatus Saccharimonadales bacterium]